MYFCVFFTKQINPTNGSTSRVDSSVPLTRHDATDLGLIRPVKKHKIHFRILSDLRIQSWIFLKKCTLRQLQTATKSTQALFIFLLTKDKKTAGIENSAHIAENNNQVMTHKFLA